MISAAAPSASQHPISRPCPAAAGGWLMICDATISVTAPALNSSAGASRSASSGTTSPRARTRVNTPIAASTRSHTSKASHAVMSGSYQFRNRLTISNSAPSTTTNGPSSSLRVTFASWFAISRGERDYISAGEGASTRQTALHEPRALAALGDRVDDQRLPDPRVAGREHALAGGRVGRSRTLPRASRSRPSSVDGPRARGARSRSRSARGPPASSNSLPGIGSYWGAARRGCRGPRSRGRRRPRAGWRSASSGARRPRRARRW